MELLGQLWQSFVKSKPWKWILSGIGIPVRCWFFHQSRKNTTPSQKETDNNLSACPPRLRQRLLNRFRNDLDIRLSSLFDERIPLNLDKELPPQEVVRPYHPLRDILYEQKGCTPQITARSIIDIFQDKNTGERLAILGKPGSGKTICLLQLLDHLLRRAVEDEQAPLPVIFECSEWDGKDLVGWMGRQLSKNYRGLKEKLAEELVRSDIIFPLFDGLDELLQSRQDEFVRVFNKFQVGRSTVLCCRDEEYRKLKEKIEINHSVTLQDISTEKLKGYIKRLQLNELWDFLQRSQKEGDESSLFELAHRPLFLNIILMLEEEESLRQDKELRSGKKEEDRLWQLYLDYCLKEERSRQLYLDNWQEEEELLFDHTASTKDNDKKNNPEKEKFLLWLHCLASYMVTERKVELQVKELRPTMLKRRWWFSIACGLSAWLSFGLALGITLGNIVGLASGAGFVLSEGQASMLVPGLLVGLVYGMFPMLFLWLTYGLIPGLFFALAYGLRDLYRSKKKILKPEQNRAHLIRSSLQLQLAFIGAAMLIFTYMAFFVEKSVPLKEVILTNVYLALLGVLFICLIRCRPDTIAQRYLLRLSLWQEKKLPLRLVRWLEFLHHRKILQRVGGSYHFIHKQLLEYLARTHSAQSKPDS